MIIAKYSARCLARVREYTLCMRCVRASEMCHRSKGTFENVEYNGGGAKAAKISGVGSSTAAQNHLVFLKFFFVVFCVVCVFFREGGVL